MKRRDFNQGDLFGGRLPLKGAPIHDEPEPEPAPTVKYEITHPSRRPRYSAKEIREKGGAS